MSWWISVSVAGIKLISLGGGAGGKRNGSGESDGKNLVRMRSILSLKKSRNVLARDGASGDSGSEFEGFRWRIVLRVFQSVRGLSDDSVTRLDKNEDLALEMRDRTELHWARNFMRSKGDFQRCQHRSSRLRSRLAWRISGLIHGMWGLWTTVLDLIGAWMSRMDSGLSKRLPWRHVGPVGIEEVPDLLRTVLVGSQVLGDRVLVSRVDVRTEYDFVDESATDDSILCILSYLNRVTLIMSWSHVKCADHAGSVLVTLVVCWAHVECTSHTGSELVTLIIS